MLGAIREANRLLELQGKLVGRIKEGAMVNINVVKSENLKIVNFVLNVVDPYPEIKQKLIDGLRRIEEQDGRQEIY